MEVSVGSRYVEKFRTINNCSFLGHFGYGETGKNTKHTNNNFRRFNHKSAGSLHNHLCEYLNRLQWDFCSHSPLLLLSRFPVINFATQTQKNCTKLPPCVTETK